MATRVKRHMFCCRSGPAVRTVTLVVILVTTLLPSGAHCQTEGSNAAEEMSAWIGQTKKLLKQFWVITPNQFSDLHNAFTLKPGENPFAQIRATFDVRTVNEREVEVKVDWDRLLEVLTRWIHSQRAEARINLFVMNMGLVQALTYGIDLLTTLASTSETAEGLTEQVAQPMSLKALELTDTIMARNKDTMDNPNYKHLTDDQFTIQAILDLHDAVATMSKKVAEILEEFAANGNRNHLTNSLSLVYREFGQSVPSKMNGVADFLQPTVAPIRGVQLSERSAFHLAKGLERGVSELKLGDRHLTMLGQTMGLEFF